MNEYYNNPAKPKMTPQSHVIDSWKDIAQNSGDMRATILNGQTMNEDQASGMVRAIEESIDRTFGAISLEEQLESDRQAYELKPLS